MRMFCSGCGQHLTPGQPVCAQCGRPTAAVPTAAPPPPITNIAFELANYATRVRALKKVWFIYGLLVLFTGMIGRAGAGAGGGGGGGAGGRGPGGRGGGTGG